MVKMSDKTLDFLAQAGIGAIEICKAIEGLKQWKTEYKEQTGLDLDISDDLKGIRGKLNDLMRITEEEQ